MSDKSQTLIPTFYGPYLGKPAANGWQKYTSKENDLKVNERCLCSIIINLGLSNDPCRRYAMGFITDSGDLCVVGYGVVEINDTFYFARINEIEDI